MIYIDFKAGFNLPPYWLNHPQVVKQFNEGSGANELYKKYAAQALLGNPCAAPLKIKWEEETENEWWEFPIEPVITITCKNIIVRRNVLKQDSVGTRRGSVKETWSQDDYEVSIAGLLISKDASALPESEIRTLRRYFEGRKVIQVKSDLFTLFNIEQLVIEDFSLPFTKGIENQMFTLKCYSDEVFNLLYEDSL